MTATKTKKSDLKKAVILAKNGFIEINGEPVDSVDLWKNRDLMTVITNCNYYGFMPSKAVIDRLAGKSRKQLKDIWSTIDAALAEITADNRNMGEFVVYHNFPKEVLDMSQTEYWFKQIAMYFGFNKDLFRQEKVKRNTMFDNVKLRVLHLADINTPQVIFDSLVESSARWTTDQKDQVDWLVSNLGVVNFSVTDASFRENGVIAAAKILTTRHDANVKVDDATDVLRLAALLSDGDVTLRDKVNFKSFSRPQRRFLINMLENSKNLEADVAERQAEFKRLFRRLHPGDFKNKFPRVTAVYDSVYNRKLKSAASKVEAALRSITNLHDLPSRPGDFMRRFHKAYDVFGREATDAMVGVLDELSTMQLLKFQRYVMTINKRRELMFAPKGNWSRVQVKLNNKVKIGHNDVRKITDAIDNILEKRLEEAFPEGLDVDAGLMDVKLQTNDQDLMPYGRGTIFQIPEGTETIRSASYWKVGGSRNVWFDNGWNFYNAHWRPEGTICWNSTHHGRAAVFSGDPVTGGDAKGRGCQMIDLNIRELKSRGVRFAVWSVLCYSHIAFNGVEEVIATLQFCEHGQDGALYEPSRAQIATPIKGNNISKYVVYADLERMEIVYLDANFSSDVSSAERNEVKIGQLMRAYVEYLDTIPSVLDLFCNAKLGETPILRTDEDVKLIDGKKAYVFEPRNKDNSFEQIDINSLL